MLDVEAEARPGWERVPCPACGAENWRRIVLIFGDLMTREVIWCEVCRHEIPAPVA